MKENLLFRLIVAMASKVILNISERSEKFTSTFLPNYTSFSFGTAEAEVDAR